MWVEAESLAAFLPNETAHALEKRTGIPAKYFQRIRGAEGRKHIREDVADRVLTALGRPELYQLLEQKKGPLSRPLAKQPLGCLSLCNKQYNRQETN